MVRSQESAESTASGETKDPQPVGCRLIAEMENSSCGTEPHLDKSKDHQLECEAVQFTESDKEVYVNPAEQEAVSGPIGIFSHVAQGNAVSDRLQSTELANLQKTDTALIEVLHEEKQTDITTNETEEHSTDITNQDQPDLEDSEELLGDLEKVENRIKTTSSPDPQTSHKDQSSPKPYHEHSLDVNEDGMLVQEAEETRMDQKARYDHPERISVTVLETHFNSEIPLQATEEIETLEPLTKKRLRRRMGMCGLGDRKRKFPFDGQHCRPGLTGRHREEGAGKGNGAVQHLYNTLLENDGTTPMDHEGTTGPVCKENEEVLKDKENSGASVMDDKITTGVAEKENRCALRNMSKFTALMDDEVTTDESPTENKNVQKKGILEEDDGTITMDDEGTAEQMVLKHELSLLEEISTGEGQTVLSPTIGKNLTAATNDHEMETTTCADDPNVPGPDLTKNGQDIKFNMKHDILSEKQNLRADNKVDEDPDEIGTEVEIAQEVSSAAIYAIVEMPEGSVTVTDEVQEVPSGLEESEMEIEAQQAQNMAATEKLDPNESTEKGLHTLLVNSMDIAAMDSRNAENKKISAVSENRAHAGGANSISEPQVPPTGQENHVHCLLDQNVRDTPVTPSVAEQQVRNPALTPAANELPQETCVGLSAPLSLYSVTDSQLHKIALSMELEDQPVPEGCDQQEDATELVRGLIGELSSLNRTVMAAHREVELLRRGRLAKVPNRRTCSPRHTEM